MITTLTILSVLISPFIVGSQTSTRDIQVPSKKTDVSLHADVAQSKSDKIGSKASEGFSSTESEEKEKEKEEVEYDEIISAKDTKISYFCPINPFLFPFQNLNLINFPELVWKPPQNAFS